LVRFSKKDDFFGPSIGIIEGYYLHCFPSYLQVKIIKCLVENIVVDISFNQLGGLCTLCFLEEVIWGIPEASHIYHLNLQEFEFVAVS